MFTFSLWTIWGQLYLTDFLCRHSFVCSAPLKIHQFGLSIILWEAEKDSICFLACSSGKKKNLKTKIAILEHTYQSLFTIEKWRKSIFGREVEWTAFRETASQASNWGDINRMLKIDFITNWDNVYPSKHVTRQ